MSKSRRILAFILVCVTIISLTVTAAASSNTPYGKKTLYVSHDLLTDTAKAYISKCGCNPVDNYLMAGIQVQYKEGNQYKWTPGSGTYYYDSGTNIGYATESITKTDINFAKAWFQARCRSGEVKSYTSSMSDPER